MDKTKFENRKHDIDATMKREGQYMDTLKANKDMVMKHGFEVLEDSNLDSELKEILMQRTNESLSEITSQGEEHSKTLDTIREDGESLKEDVNNTAAAAQKSAEKLNKLSGILEKVGITAVSDAAAAAQNNAEEWKSRHQEIIDKNSNVDALRDEFSRI